MAVYVDNYYLQQQGWAGRMRMSHMIADSTEELLDMVYKIGVDPKHIQYPGTIKEHFDVCNTKRAIAVFHGAKEITFRELASMISNRSPKPTLDDRPAQG